MMQANETLQEMVLWGLMWTKNPHQLQQLDASLFRGRNAQIFNAAKEIHLLGEVVDPVVIGDKIDSYDFLADFKKHDATYCKEYLSELSSSLVLDWYKQQVMKEISGKKFRTATELKDAMMSVCLPTYDPVDVKNITASHEGFMHNLIKAREQTSHYRGIMTMVDGIDKLAGGLCKSHMIVIAARPSVGKTAFGLFLTGKAIMQQKRVLFVSTEMDENAILARLYSQFLHIPTSHLTHYPKNLSEQDLEVINNTAEEFENIIIETGFGLPVTKLYSRVAMLAKNGGLDMVVVDYLQNLKGEGDNMVEKLGNISNMLKKIAMDFEIPVVALAQLNRQAQHLDVPSMAEIKGSGTIEQDADLIMLLHHNAEEEPEKYWVICDKNRHGEIGAIPMIFKKKYQTFMQDSPEKRFLKASAKKTSKGF